MAESGGRWNLFIDSAAARDLRKLPPPTQARISAALESLRDSFPDADVKKLKGFSDRWRLRVGDYRVMIKPSPEQRQLVALRILRRDRAYRH